MTVVNVNQRLAALTAAGTAVWLDQIRRSLTEGGELQRLVDEDSLRGVTSNPAIFEKAILGSPDYDEQIERMAREGCNPRTIYQAIAVEDVGAAADVLRGVHDELGGADGFVSLEVDPDLAFDTERTLAQAREYFKRVDRPNVMIKIPGTPEGVPAIEQAVYEGINVNVTLLFSVAAYEQIAEAYIRGLERRHADGADLGVHSVASFFVSRVDSEVDKRLEALGRTDLAGTAALANARAAYARFETIFGGERFAALRTAGAPVQRPLWASTGVKNPAYPETMYVDGLVAPDTVNTMPMATLLAAAEHAEIAGATAEQDPRPALEALREAGIDMDDVTDTLLREGVDAFVTPMEKLLAGIEAKREAIVTGRPQTIDASLPDELEPAVAEIVRRAGDEHVARRIWSKDDTLWGPAGQAEVADRLGWLTVAGDLRRGDRRPRGLRRAGRRRRLHRRGAAGHGRLEPGARGAPPELRRAPARPPAPARPGLHRSRRRAGAPERRRPRAHAVSSCRRSRAERSRRCRCSSTSGRCAAHGEQFVAITDPGSSLQALAAERGFRRTFCNDPDIGGRYSALSFFGLVPAALMGVDLEALLDGAGVAAEACRPTTSRRATAGCGWAPRSASWPWPAATS